MAFTPKVDWANRKAPGTKGYRNPGSKKPGPKRKDTGLSQNTAQTLTAEERRLMRNEAARIKREEAAREKRAEKARQQIADLSRKMEEAKTRIAADHLGVSLLQPTDDADQSFESRVLKDLLWAYEQVDGRKTLLRLIQDDDKQFAFLLKELIRFETMKEEKKKGGGNGQGFFVVIRGLADEQALKSMMGEDANTITTDRIAISMDMPEDIRSRTQTDPEANRPQPDENPYSQDAIIPAPDARKMIKAGIFSDIAAENILNPSENLQSGIMSPGAAAHAAEMPLAQDGNTASSQTSNPKTEEDDW